MFRAAIFDLDGTLLDSMNVWSDVDDVYFAEIGIPLPPDYGRALSGLSFTESAAYTKKRFGLSASVSDIIARWTALSDEEYRLRVTLKPGAAEYLSILREMGVKLAVATALPPRLYRDCLSRNGILDAFDVCCTTGDIGDGSKASGEIFRHAAGLLGEEPKDCAVFEDVLDAIRGAKKCGMRVYAVEEPASRHAQDDIAREADGVISDFRDMKKFHPFPGGTCVVVTGRAEGDIATLYSPCPRDLVLAADAGWQIAERAGIAPDMVIGDFDSSPRPAGGDILYHPPEKDDTDTMMALRRGLAAGYRDFVLLGGLGGELSHTLANLESLAFLADAGARGIILDGAASARLVLPGEPLRLSVDAGQRVSVFAFNGAASGVDLHNLKYELQNATLTPSYPIGVSNEALDGEAAISVKCGRLLVITD